MTASSATKTSLSFGSGWTRWPVIAAILLFFGTVSFATQYVFQPDHALDEWNVAPTAASDPVPAIETWARR